MQLPSHKKPPFPVDRALHSYLRSYAREILLPIAYDSLRHFTESVPLTDNDGKDTLWLTVIYTPHEMQELSAGLRHVYALLKASGDLSVMDHLRVERIDFCEFGNSQPFRIRIVNKINDNHDYFYVKKADASRIYGLELEHILSPNRMHFLVHKDTLIEEHVIGIPGDIFIQRKIMDSEFREVRIAKEFVKFNERCFIRLLGDMRACNYVVDMTQDFEEVHYRIRAMDFDQQSYEGRASFYRPQFFTDNNPLIKFGLKHVNLVSGIQYQREERASIAMRMRTEEYRLTHLLNAMEKQPLSTQEKIRQLSEGLADHYKNDAFLRCNTMGEVVRNSLKMVHYGTTGVEAGSELKEFVA